MGKKTENLENEENIKKLEVDENTEDVSNDTANEEINKDEYIAKLNDDLNEQKKKTDEYFEHLKRNMAEFDNFKKRITKEKESLYKTVISDILDGLLPIMDNFEQALNSSCTDEKFKEGVQMIYNQMSEYMKSQGLEEIEDIGKTFDPNFHEAVMHEENESYGEKEIIEVFRKGYKIGEKVIRHSMVKVAN